MKDNNKEHLVEGHEKLGSTVNGDFNSQNPKGTSISQKKLTLLQLIKGKSAPIFSITIEIAQDKHNIHIFKRDTPDEIAHRFCQQNDWDLTCVGPVSKKIEEAFQSCLSNPNLAPKLQRKLKSLLPQKPQQNINQENEKQEIFQKEYQQIDYRNQEQPVLQESNQNFDHPQLQEQSPINYEEVEKACDSPPPQEVQHDISNSRRYFCYQKLSTHIQQQAAEQIRQQYKEREQTKSSKRSLSLDNNHNNSSTKWQQVSSTQTKMQNQQPENVNNNTYLSFPKMERAEYQQMIISNSIGNTQQSVFSQANWNKNSKTLLHSSSAERSSKQGFSNQPQQQQNCHRQLSYQQNSPDNNKANYLSLYERGVYYCQQKKSKINQIQQSIKENELVGCTFIPKTNQKANQQLLQHRDKSIDPYYSLYNQGRASEMKKALIKDRLLIEEQKDLPFKPIINPLSQLIVKAKREDRLLSENENQIIRAAKKAAIEQDVLRECTFHPQVINKQNRPSNQTIPVYDRLYMSGGQKKRYEETLKFESKSKKNTVTVDDQDEDVNNIFSHNVPFENEQDNENIQGQQGQSTSLPPRTSLSKSRKQTPAQQSQNGSFFKDSEKSSAYNFSPNKNSLVIMEKKKLLRFEQIFAQLDGDKDGLISAEKIDIKQVPIEILVVIAPLLYELEDMKIQLSQSDFMQAIEMLFKQLSLPDKNKLLLYDTFQKWQQEKQNLSATQGLFQPSINPNSDQIAQNNRSREGSTNLYDLYKTQDKMQEEKLLQKRREKENEINAHCTFHPTISAPPIHQTNNQPDTLNFQSCQKAFQELLAKHAPRF